MNTRSTHCFRALGHEFSVEAEPHLVDYLDWVFDALRCDGVADAHRYKLVPDRAVPGQWEVRFDGEQLASSISRGFIYSHLCWHVNREAIRNAAPDHLLLHASAAADARGRAVLLPATMESGKTTTVAGLVRAGLRYLTDEAVVIDLGRGDVVAYPKPLSIDRGSWPVLPELRPDLAPGIRPYLRSQWQVPGAAVGAVADRATPALVVAPHYHPEVRRVEVRELTRGETMMQLAGNSFNLAAHGERGFRALEEIAATCPGYQVRIGDLAAAVSEIARLLEASADVA